MDPNQQSESPRKSSPSVGDARLVYAIGKKLAKGIGKKAATASLGPGAIIAIVLLFLSIGAGLFMFGLIGGGIGGTTATEDQREQLEPGQGTPVVPPGPVDTSPLPKPPCIEIDSKLRTDFGIIIEEGGESVSCDIRQKVYQIYSIPTKSPTYLSHLKPAVPFTIRFISDNTAGAHGLTTSPNLIQLWNMARFLSIDSNFRSASIFLVHETGHLIKHRDWTLFNDNYPNSYFVSKEPGCYDQGFLKTYSHRDTNPVSESMAEASALYIYQSKNGKYATINNFRSECPETYNWMYKNLYGGVEF